MLRTHTCGELTLKDEKNAVKLCGWNHSRRDHGGIIFIDLRDRYGLTQLVFDPKHNKEAHETAEHLGREDVLQVSGKARYRGKGLENPKLFTGEIEVIVDEINILSKSLTPPIEIDDDKEANDDIRLKYRYLDLRRPKMIKRLTIRHKAAQAAREFLTNNDFLEITTPLLVKATPEGARDYVVPSRVNPGKFYALPQSPQLYKQISMVSGLDRYFQLPICLRDEDLRQDRQPEHMQIDIEMSFVELEDLHNMFERLMQHIFKKTIDIDLKLPFKKISYDESMARYGTDKPDLRYGLGLSDVSENVIGCEFSVFKNILKDNGTVKCISPEKIFSRNEIDEYIAFAQQHGAKGMAWMKVTENGLESSVAKYFPKAVQQDIINKTKAKPGSTLMFIADKEKTANEVLSKLRQKLADDLKLYNTNDYAFCWITDFPLFEWNEEENSWQPAHHMFCMPKKEHIPLIEKSPEKVYCTQYDLVLNGVELGSGSIRIHDPEIQEKVMKVVGFSKEQAGKRFGFLLESFKYGAPPHGGIGIGFDRTVALLCGLNDIREVIAFPKNKAAECPMDGSPSDIEDRQFKELHIKLDMVKKKDEN